MVLALTLSNVPHNEIQLDFFNFISTYKMLANIKCVGIMVNKTVVWI